MFSNLTDLLSDPVVVGGVTMSLPNCSRLVNAGERTNLPCLVQEKEGANFPLINLTNFFKITFFLLSSWNSISNIWVSIVVVGLLWFEKKI